GKRSGFDSSTTPPTTVTTLRPTIAATPKLTAAAKGKQPAKATKAKSLSDLSEVAMTEAEQLKLVLRRSRQQMHISQLGGSGTDEGTCSKPGVSDVPSDDSKEEISWNSSDDKDADAQEKDGDDDEGDERDESDDEEEDDDDNKDGDERDDDYNQEIAKIDEQDDTERSRDDAEENSEDDGNDEEDQGLKDGEEERLNEEADSHVTVTPVKPDGQQESSSVSSQFVTSMMNPTSDAGVGSIFATASTSVTPLPTPKPTMTPSIIATITTASQAPIPPTPILSEVLQNLPTFDSVFCFDDRLKSLEASFSKYKQTTPFAEAVSKIPGIVYQYMNQQMNEAVQVAVQIQTDRLHDSYQIENDEFLRTIDENMKRIIKEQDKGQVKEQVSRILQRIKQSVNAQLEAEKIEGNKSIQCSDEQKNLYKALVEAYEADKIILDTYRETITLKRRRDDESDKDEGPSVGSDWGSKRRREGKEPESASALLETATRSAGRSTTGSKSRLASASESDFVEEPVQTTSQIEEPSHPPKKPPTPDRVWNKTLPAIQGNTQTWISELTKQADYRSSFNELLDTPLDFSNFIMNQLRVDTLTLELLAGPTYELMKGSCKSLTDLEYHLEEVYKATTNQLDWVNPEGQHYLHNLLQPLPLIPDNRGRRVIPFAHFINNDLEYLQGGASSRKYTTSVTKTMTADYGHIKWIKDLVPRTMWIQEPIGLQYVMTMTSSTNLKKAILREDLQPGVESYQKRLNLTKPDTYRSDLKRREAYTSYSNLKGFIYQNKDKKNGLMRIDELHKFNDGTLNEVRNALDDCLKGIRMQYLPQTIWRKGDKDRAAAMIQAIDMMLKTRRIMRSLERFVGERLYEGDFRMLQRTI
nr:hypothetical protein [Tanacetum cinerariifolium]